MPICNYLSQGTFASAKARIVDEKITCLSQVCTEDCPHYTSCPEYEVFIREAGPKAEWKKIGLGMYELKR